MIYLIFNSEPEFLKPKKRYDEIKNLKYQTKKRNHENILKYFNIDNEFYKKKFKILNKKKVLLIITEILVGSASTFSSSTMGLINPGAGNIILSCTALLFSIAKLITNEYISKFKIRCTNLRDWINVITLLYEKTSKQSMLDKKNGGKEIEELKKIYNHYLNKEKR